MIQQRPFIVLVLVISNQEYYSTFQKKENSSYR